MERTNQHHQPLMKLIFSINVYDDTTPSEFDALIELLQSQKAKAATKGHPELPMPGIDAADPLMVDMEPTSTCAAPAAKIETRRFLIPQPGKSYRTRHGVVMRYHRQDHKNIECRCDCGPIYYNFDGTQSYDDHPSWDLVEEITE